MSTESHRMRKGRKRVWPRIRKRKNRRTTSWRVDAGMVGHARLVRQFSTRAEAEAFAADLRAGREAEKTAARFERRNRAVSLANLSDAQRSDVLAAFRTLDGTGGTLATAVAFWKQHAAPKNSRTCSEVLAELLQSTQTANRRPRTIQELEEKLGSFCSTYGTDPIARLTVADLSAWLDERTRGLSPRSRAAFRQSLNRLFNFAVRRQYREGNPVLAIEKPTVESPAPEVFTPGEARRLLEAAATLAPDMIPFYTVGLFAGLRTENELRGLDWKRIDIAGRSIEVTAAAAKRRRARFVDMSENLAAWLLPHCRGTGPIHFSRAEHRRVLASSGLAWPRNVMRHSFASYHLAQHGDAAKTSMALGHPQGVEILFAHYRKLVRPGAAHEFWSIVPSRGGPAIQKETASSDGIIAGGEPTPRTARHERRP